MTPPSLKMSCVPHCTIEFLPLRLCSLKRIVRSYKAFGWTNMRAAEYTAYVKEENDRHLGSSLCSTFEKGESTLVIGLHSFIDSSSVFDRQDFEG